MRAYRARPFLRQPRHASRHRVRAVDRPPAQPTTLLAILAQTGRTLGRHWVLFLLCALGTIVAEVAAGLLLSVHNADLAASEIIGGVFTTVVTCATFGDLSGRSRSWLIERGFERSWAVILIGLAIDLFASVGIMGLESANIVSVLIASAVLLMTATLIFATVDATISDDPWWRLLPVALSRSIVAGWRPSVFPRALIALVIGEMGDLTLYLALLQWMHGLHVPHAQLWSSSLASALLIAPVQAFTTIVYLDAIGFDRERT